MAVYGGYAASRGQDANWDLQNYHLYAAHALLSWRYPLDVGPGGFQAYLNPLPYLTPYLLREVTPPIVAAVLLAAVQALVVPIVWTLTGLMPGLCDVRWLRALATAVGSSSATALSEVGTSFADLTLASLVLGALAALLLADGRTTGGAARLLAVSGALIGMAAGLKLTNGIYVGGLAAAALAPWRGLAGFVRAASCLGGGVTAGLALTGGGWALYLWRTFSNPIFPTMNTWFRSSSAGLGDFTDLRFLPAGPVDAIAYPFRIALGEHPTAEISFADPRLAIVLALIVVASARAFQRRKAGAADRRAAPAMAFRAAVFMSASFVLWLAMFSIQRYAVALEIIAGVLLVQFTFCLSPPRLQTAACIVVSLAACGATRPADFWHRPWADAFQPDPPALLEKPAAFLIVSHPNGYWVQSLPNDSRFYSIVPTGLATGGVLRQQLVSGLLNAPNHQVWTLGADVPMDVTVRDSMAALGYVPSAPCVRARSLWWVDTVFCRAEPGGRWPLAAAELAEGQIVDFSRAGAGWIYEVSGWTNAGSTGTAAPQSSARLAFHLAPRVSVLELDVDGPAADVPVIVSVNGTTSAIWTVGRETGPTRRVLCLQSTENIDLNFTSEGDRPMGILLRAMRLRRPRPGECSP